jgi:hypothetical protein
MGDVLSEQALGSNVYRFDSWLGAGDPDWRASDRSVV